MNHFAEQIILLNSKNVRPAGGNESFWRTIILLSSKISPKKSCRRSFCRTIILVNNDCTIDPGFVRIRSRPDRSEIFIKKYLNAEKLEHFPYHSKSGFFRALAYGEG